MYAQTYSTDKDIIEIDSTKTDTTEEEYIEYFYVEESPEFPGGMKELLKYMKENLQYPEEAIEKGIEGRVICQFTVKTDGSIDNIVVLKSIHKSLDEEAIRLIKNMPKWKPGKNYKREVQDCKYTIPFSFKLPK